MIIFHEKMISGLSYLSSRGVKRRLRAALASRRRVATLWRSTVAVAQGSRLLSDYVDKRNETRDPKSES